MLSDEQFEIIKLLCDGYTQNEVAEQMAISVRTENSRIAEAKKTTGAKSTYNLIHLVLTDNIISISFNRYLQNHASNFTLNKKDTYIDRNYAYTA